MLLLSVNVNAECLNTYYFSTSGNDSTGDGSSDLPWQTITKVNNLASTTVPGDCILFKRGDTWTSSHMPSTQGILIPESGSSGLPITYGAYGTGDLPVIDGTGVTLSSNQGLIRANGKDYIVIENIRIQDAGVGDHTDTIGIDFYNSDHITIQNCEVYNTESSGIRSNTCTDMNILNNDVSSTNCYDASEQISLSVTSDFEVAYNTSYTNCNPSYSPPGGAGIDAKGGSNNGSIHHNTVYDISGGSNGIYVDAYSGHSYNVDVYSNRVYDITGAAGIMIGAEAGGELNNIKIYYNIVDTANQGCLTMHDTGTTGSAVYDIFIYNNTFYLCGSSSSTWLGGTRILDSLLTTDGVTLKNNIFSSSYQYQVAYNHTKLDGSEIVADYNLIYGNNTPIDGEWTGISGTNDISGDPLFVDAGNGDYALDTGSPGIDACDNSVWSGTPNIFDYDGTRITNSSGVVVVDTVDCGALESGAVVAATNVIKIVGGFYKWPSE